MSRSCSWSLDRSMWDPLVSGLLPLYLPCFFLSNQTLTHLSSFQGKRKTPLLISNLKSFHHYCFTSGLLLLKTKAKNLTFKKFIYLFLAALGLCAERRLSLVAVSRGYSSWRCTGFSLRWLLLLWITGSRRTDLSSCDMWAQ